MEGKSLEQIKDEVAKQFGYSSFDKWLNVCTREPLVIEGYNSLVELIANRYAEQYKPVFTLENFEGQDGIGEDCWIASLKSVAVVQAKSPKEAIDELMISLKCKMYYDNEMGLPVLAQSKWVKCSERLPDLGQVVIAYVPNATEEHFKIQVVGYDGKSFKEFMDSDDPADRHELYSEGEYLGITHWMELPQPPTA